MKTKLSTIPFLVSLLLLAIPAMSQGQTAANLIAQGDTFDAAMKTRDALEVYLEAEKLTPEDPELIIKIATQYGESMVDIADEDQRRAAGQNALTYSQRAAKIAPNLADAHLAVAICYGRLLDLMPAKEKVAYSREVKTSTERTLELDPTSDYAWHMLGRWHRAVATTSPILKGIVTIVYGGLPDASNEEAAEAFEKAIEINPNRVSHQIELGITYAEMGREEDARKAIKQGLALPDQERDDPDTKTRGRALLAEIGE